MGKFQKEKMLQAIACLTCTVVLWIHLDDSEPSQLFQTPSGRIASFPSI